MRDAGSDRPTATQWDSGVGRRGSEHDPDPDELVGAPDLSAARSLHVAVVGAGAFGGWTALHLRRLGARVTLVDAWGPGNARSSSGDETRVIRCVYGGDRIYVRWAAKALKLWRESERLWGGGQPLYHRTGVLWMIAGDDRYVRASLPILAEERLPFDEFAPGDAAKRYPQVNFDGIEQVLLEREAGFLNASHACRTVARRLVEEGGELLQHAARPESFFRSDGAGIELSDGSTLSADQYVVACGPWLGSMFPEAVGDLIKPSRQETYYVGIPTGNDQLTCENLPAWVDFGERVFYGIPATVSRGFKVADDARGAPIDPTADDRVPTPQLLEIARRQLAFRFPALEGAPLLEARVCQYANTPDGHFIIDRHPAADNMWIVGGGSGHGFKLGPAIGDFVARLVVNQRSTHPLFSLSRFAD